MKALLTLVLFLLVFTTYAQRPWPRNTRTKQIAFDGKILWPSSTKTADQRLSLVRQWYLQKLTDAGKKELITWVKDEAIPITYGSIPGISYLDYKDYKGEKEIIRLTFNVNLQPDKLGLTYQLSNFEYVWGGEDVTSSCALETAVLSRESNQAALQVLRRRLELALSSW
jgi:hypothetical protein